MAVNIRPLNDRIIVRRIEEDEQMRGGLYIPDTAKEKPQEGEVIAVGNGRILDNGSQRRHGRQGWRPYPVRQVFRNRDQARWR